LYLTENTVYPLWRPIGQCCERK